jgi:hypothetical protein
MDQDHMSNTPFSAQRATLPKPKRQNYTLIFGVGALCVVILVVGVLLGRGGKAGDKFRTLETFPTADFLDNYEMLLGNKFKMNVTVDAELGTEEGKGKLVVFRDSQSKKVVPVLIPTAVIPNFALSKSQKYNLILEVTKSGILNAINLEKE